MPDTTYFQDVLTTGDTILKQNLVVQGTWTYFVSNLGSTTDQLAKIGSISAPVGNIFSGGSNLTTLNVPSIPAVIGINTSTGVGANLTVSGNTVASNAISTPSVFSTNVNTSGTTNTVTLIATSNIGIGTTPSTGANLYIVGNAYLTNSVTATNFFATSVNVSGTANIASFQGSVSIPTLNISGVTNLMTVVATSNMGIGTTPSVVTNLYVVGNAYLTNDLAASNVLSTNVNVSGTTNVLTVVAASNIGIGTTPAISGAQLTITGNAYLTNSLTTSNVLSTNVNVSGTTNLVTLVATSNIGIGTRPAASGAQLTITGNAYLTNSLTTSNVLSTNVNVSGTTNLVTLVATSNIGIGTRPVASGAQLTITGNAYLTNALTVSNIDSLYVNVSATTNVLTLLSVSKIGIGTIPAFDSRQLSIIGNAYITNSLTTSTVFTTNVNVSGTTNTLTLVATSNIGIGTKPAVNGSKLYVVGNVVIGNTLTTTNIFTTNLQYNEDATNRSIHLLPTSANSATIQGWISTTCNNVGANSFWRNVPTVYTNTATSSGGSAYSGSVYLPNDRVLFVPANTSNVGIYNPTEQLFSNITGTGVAGGNFQGGVLLPTGNVIFVPQNSNVGMLNPLTYKFSNAITLPSGKYNGTLTSNGVVFTPKGTPSNIINYNFTTGTWANTVPFSQAPTSVYQNWQVAPGQITNGRWWDVCWSPELMMFVACGDNSEPYNFAWSTDGFYWNYAVTGIAYAQFFKVCWSPQRGMFVAVGYQIIAISYDGLNWTTVDTTIDIQHNDVRWSPQLGIFVAVGGNIPYTNYGYIRYSYDGITWTEGTHGFVAKYMNTVEWSPKLGYFVACGVPESTEYKLLISYDGINWTQPSLPTFTPVDYQQKIKWCQELQIFTTSGYTRQWSTDGISWYFSTFDSGVLIRNSTGIDWSPQLGVFINPQWEGVGMLYSIDGKNWSNVTGAVYAPEDYTGLWPQTFWRGAAWSPELGRFAIVGYDTYYDPSSPYGLNWMATNQLSPISLNYWKPATTNPSQSLYTKSIYDSGAGTYIAVGAGGSGTYNATWSSDGINWNNPSSYSAVSGNENTGLATGTNMLNCTIAVGGRSGSAAAYTTDGGVNWYGTNLNGFQVTGGHVWTDVAMSDGGVTWAVGWSWDGYNPGGPGTECSAYWMGPIYDYWIHPTSFYGYRTNLYDVDPYAHWEHVVYTSAGGSGSFLAVAPSIGSTTDTAWCLLDGTDALSWQALSPSGTSFLHVVSDRTSLVCGITGWGDVWWWQRGPGMNYWFFDGNYGYLTSGNLTFSRNFMTSFPGGYKFVFITFNGYVYTSSGPYSGWTNMPYDMPSNLMSYSWTTITVGPTSTSPIVAIRSDSTAPRAAYYSPTTIPPYVPQCESSGAQLLPSGNVAFLSPGSSNIVQYNPVNLTISNTNVVSYSSTGMVLAPNGNVFCMPNLSNIKVYNPTSLTVSNIVTGKVNYRGGVLLPSGNLVAIPGSQSNIGMVNTTSLTFSNLTVFKSSNNMNFSGGTLIPSGKVVFCPSNVTNVGILDTFTPIASTFCLSPYFNKF